MGQTSYSCNICGQEWGLGTGDKPWIQHQCIGSAASPQMIPVKSVAALTPEQMADKHTEEVFQATERDQPGYANLVRSAYLEGYNAGYDDGFTQRKVWRK